MSHGPNWHSCSRWKNRGMVCPFPGEGMVGSSPGAEGPDWKWPYPGPPSRRKLTDKERSALRRVSVILRARERVNEGLAPFGVRSLEVAETMVAQQAEQVSMPQPTMGQPVASNLRGELVAKGLATAATGVAAAWAIRQVYRGGGGGYKFQAVINPLKPRLAR